MSRSTSTSSPITFTSITSIPSETDITLLDPSTLPPTSTSTSTSTSSSTSTASIRSTTSRNPITTSPPFTSATTTSIRSTTSSKTRTTKSRPSTSASTTSFSSTESRDTSTTTSTVSSSSTSITSSTRTTTPTTNNDRSTTTRSTSKTTRTQKVSKDTDRAPGTSTKTVSRSLVSTTFVTSSTKPNDEISRTRVATFLPSTVVTAPPLNTATDSAVDHEKMIAGIVVGAAFGFILLICLILFCLGRIRRRKEKDENENIDWPDMNGPSYHESLKDERSHRRRRSIIPDPYSHHANYPSGTDRYVPNPNDVPPPNVMPSAIPDAHIRQHSPSQNRPAIFTRSPVVSSPLASYGSGNPNPANPKEPAPFIGFSSFNLEMGRNTSQYV